MRRAKRIVTKGHLLIFATTPEKNDDIWTRQIISDQNNIQSMNATVVFTSGNVGTFTSNGSEWRKHLDALAPLMCVWPTGRTVGKTSGGWAMVNNANTVGTVTAIIPREDYNKGHWEEMSNANTQEASLIESNSEQSVVLDDQCTTDQKRDLITMDVIDETQDIELEIDWGSYSNT
jgi:hypothetical protein